MKPIAFRNRRRDSIRGQQATERDHSIRCRRETKGRQNVCPVLAISDNLNRMGIPAAMYGMKFLAEGKARIMTSKKLETVLISAGRKPAFTP
ncbi:hypothetical protein [Candidatus Sodalis sp. SoCistrobi]|uniref:hypothetical protein n=1 Tax=Candidatus Sodalis sp. SoCistrobi TaxID=1922216 RepID=UPI000F79B997|nr:hypothetical protein [Candidatus Sodalis sp. SoCistrobi]